MFIWSIEENEAFPSYHITKKSKFYFSMIIEVLLDEEEVIVWQGKGITGSGAVDVQPLWTEEQQKIGEVKHRKE